MRKSAMSSKTLVTLALLSAIEVVLARLIVPMPNATTRFSIEAVPIIVAGLLFGPVSGALVGLVGDVVGCLFSGFG
ncbi:MAG: folate family ECF transporter S component, partial [Clostridia bacterium]|nr:folate family ECF transporter S component [Clostridia bacterium]